MLFLYLQMIAGDEDRRKFERLYIKYRNLMMHVALKILGNREDAEDAVHQAFVSVIQNLEKIDESQEQRTRSFVVTITENKSVDIIRKRSRVTSLEEIPEPQGLVIPLPGDNGLADAIAKLPARYRNVLLLRYDNGYSTREIAKMNGMNYEAVKRLITRAKAALDKQLESMEQK